MKLTLLGTGTSGGVPQIGCTCRTCMSGDPRDRRTRCSAMIETDDTCIMIDCSPDFRQQMLNRPFRRIDGIFITHEHYDHVGGIDDIRPGILFGDVTIYAEQLVAQHLMERIPYCFTPEEKRYPGVPAISLKYIEPHVPVCVGSIEVLPIRVMQGKLPIVGFRIGRLAYITDMKSFPESEWKYLDGTELLVVNALHHKPHPSHQSVDDAIEFARKVGAAETYFIHMSHFVLPHAEEDALLPQHIHLAYDGMELSVD